MRRAGVETLLAVAVGIVGATAVPRAVVDRSVALETRATGVPTPPVPPPSDPADSNVWQQGPFRTDRRPPALRWSPGALAPGAGSVDPERPALRLAGVVGGAERLALVEGLPGFEGVTRLVRVGEAFGSLRVEAVERDTVVVLDTENEHRWRFGLESKWVR